MKYKLSTPLYIYELGKRANQEDYMFPEPGKATADDRMFLVCDGMGGHEHGEVASKAVCETIGNYLLKLSLSQEVFEENEFKNALSAAYDALDEKDDGAYKKMGTTMTFIKFHKGGCMVAHIGDSRIYQIRPKTAEIIYKSRDHSLVNDLYEIGEITLEEMKTSKQRNVITRAMQPHQERRSKADIRNLTDIQPGDYFYLCSDGMLEDTEDEFLLNVFKDKKTDDEEKVRILTEASKENKDNHSAYLIHVLKVQKENGDKEIIHQNERKNDAASENNVSKNSVEGQTASSTIASRSRRGKKIMLFLVILLLLILGAGYFFFYKNGCGIITPVVPPDSITSPVKNTDVNSVPQHGCCDECVCKKFLNYKY